MLWKRTRIHRRKLCDLSYKLYFPIHWKLSTLLQTISHSAPSLLSTVSSQTSFIHCLHQLRANFPTQNQIFRVWMDISSHLYIVPVFLLLSANAWKRPSVPAVKDSHIQDLRITVLCAKGQPNLLPEWMSQIFKASWKYLTFEPLVNNI